jgi:hypothetical protein
LVSLFFTYAAIGALLAAVGLLLFMVLKPFIVDPAASHSLPSVAQAMQLIVFLWLFGLVPAGVASFLMCVGIATFPALYEDRGPRTLMALVLGAVVSPFALCLLFYGQRGLTWPHIVSSLPFSIVGAISAALAGCMWPRKEVPNAA